MSVVRYTARETRAEKRAKGRLPVSRRSAAIVVMATLLMLCFGMATDGFTAYLPYLRGSYAVSDLQVSLLVTLRCVTSFVSALLAHSLYGRISIRAGMTVSVVCLAAGFAVCGIVPSYEGACVGSLFLGVTCGIGSTVPASMLMHRWFAADVALPLCICMAGSGLSSVVGVPLIVAGISAWGMTATFFAEAGVFAAVAVLMWLVVCDSPDVGTQGAALRNQCSEDKARVCEDADAKGRALEARGHACAKVAASSPCKPAPTFAISTAPTVPTQTLGPRDFSIMAVAVLFIGAIASPGPANYSLLLTESGAPAASVAGIISVGGIALTLSKLAYGGISRRFGTYRSNALAFGLLASGMACSLLIGAWGPVAGIVLVVLCGLGFPTATAGPSLWVNDLFAHDFDRSVQRLQVAYSLGTLVGMPLPGLVASATGSYVPVYATYAVLAVVILAVVQSHYRKAGLTVPAERGINRKPCVTNMPTTCHAAAHGAR